MSLRLVKTGTGSLAAMVGKEGEKAKLPHNTRLVVMRSLKATHLARRNLFTGPRTTRST